MVRQRQQDKNKENGPTPQEHKDRPDRCCSVQGASKAGLRSDPQLGREQEREGLVGWHVIYIDENTDMEEAVTTVAEVLCRAREVGIDI